MHKICAAVGVFALIAGSVVAQTASTAPTPRPDLLEIYQIDLVPTGTAFALTKPVLEGDAWVFKNWPERQMVRLDKTKVRQISPRTKDLNKEVVYQIDLVPTGRMIARDNPTLKGTTYTFHEWKGGKIMSIRKDDVLRILMVTGLPAFRIEQEERGAALIGNLPMEGTGSVTVISGAPPDPAPAASQPSAPAQGNWSYQGAPGITDAYAPPSAVVSSPGDVPKAAPAPTPPPR
jgi:hypothetical protein